MKQKTINYSWPATLSDFSQDKENEKFTRCKLKVFYQGETPDHRYFSPSFSKEVVKSLPYTPVVAHYDSETKDFVGHATQQEIYGLIDPTSEIVFETLDDGNDWCVADVVLYTERPDQVGEIAQKIVGHKQSLELDPRTTKYKINYDERKHFKNIEFTAGSFVGVSVLGETERPAFTGSEFFSLDTQFKQKMEILKNYCEGKPTDIGDIKMNTNDFIRLSWGDISLKVSEAVEKEYGAEYYTSCVDFYEDCAIVRFYSYLDGSLKLMRIYYKIDADQNVTLGNINEVHVTYEDVQASAGETGNNFESSVDFEDNSSDDFALNDSSDDEFELNDSSEDNNFTQTNADPIVTTSVVNAEVAVAEEGATVNEEKQNLPSPAAFTEGKEAELENSQREKKLAILKTFESTIDEEDYNELNAKIDDFSEDGLTFFLNKLQNRQQAPMVPFAMFPEPEKKETSTSKLASYIRANLSK